MDFAPSFALVAPELLLTGAGLALLLVAAWGGDKAARLIAIAGAAALFGAGLMLVPGLHLGTDGPATLAFGGLLKVDSFALFAKALIYLAAIGALVVAPAFFAGAAAGTERGMRAEYPVLILFAAVGMSIMVSANDFMSLYLGLELNSLSAYVLAAILRRDTRSGEAGLKYFVLGALASGILLYGMSLLYGFTGGTGFAAVRSGLTGELAYGPLFGLIFVLAGLAFKISAVPFHMWTPDVYEGAPTPVTAFFATAAKVAAVAVTVRIIITAFPGLQHEWRQIVVFVAILSMALGSFAAIGQTNIKRLMAYSSIGHMGFALVGLAAGTEQGVAGVMIYMAIYVLMTLGTFAAILSMRVGDRYVEDIADLAGLSRTNGLMAFVIAMMMFSLAGIPPLAGFFAKWYVFLAAINGNLYGLAVIGMLASVVAAFYYLRIVRIMYFDESARPFERANVEVTAVMAVMGLFVVIFSFFPGPAVVQAAAAAAKSLF